MPKNKADFIETPDRYHDWIQSGMLECDWHYTMDDQADAPPSNTR